MVLALWLCSGLRWHVALRYNFDPEAGGVTALAEDQAKPARAAEPKEPFDVWWPKYLARVADSVRAAEQHLEVPPGTISSIPSELDFIATVKTYAVIEPILNERIAAHRRGILGFELADTAYRTFLTRMNIGGNTGKLALANALGLLTPWEIDFIDAVARIRNRYAHNVKNMHKSLTDILTEGQVKKGNIVAHITGMQIKLPLPLGLGNQHLKEFMYFQLADYLANALQTLRPPPLPKELGALLGVGTVSNASMS